jgi:hypothetical protein
MAFQVTVHQGPFLLFVASGPARLSELMGAVNFLGTVAYQQGSRRALLDLLAVEVQLAGQDYVELGQYFGQQLEGMERVAAVVQQQYRVGTGEKAGQDAGLNVRIFSRLNEAITWLTG